MRAQRKMAHNVDYAIASRCDKIRVCTSSGASEAYHSKRARAGEQAWEGQATKQHSSIAPASVPTSSFWCPLMTDCGVEMGQTNPFLPMLLLFMAFCQIRYLLLKVKMTIKTHESCVSVPSSERVTAVVTNWIKTPTNLKIPFLPLTIHFYEFIQPIHITKYRLRVRM